MSATPIPLLPNDLERETSRGDPGTEGDEATLIARAQAGDHTAFEAIFTQYQTQIYNYAYRMMGNAEDACELSQDAWLKVWLALPKTRDELNFRAWVYRIITNVCLDELRHRKLVQWTPWDAFISVFHPSQVAKDNPERDCLDRGTEAEVREVLNKLKPAYRACLLLREYGDLSYEEIAAVLGTTRSAVKSRLWRSRCAFAENWLRIPGQQEAPA